MIGNHKIELLTIDKEINTKYEIVFKRKITVLRGDSGTGKSTMIDLLENFLYNKDLDIKVKSDLEIDVWRMNNFEAIKNIIGKVIFVDEEDLVFSEEKIDFINNSDNYFVIVVRENLEKLSFSTEEIYKLVSEIKNGIIENRMVKVYEKSYNTDIEIDKNIKIVTEDSNSGKKFFEKLFKRECFSLQGNRNINQIISKFTKEEIILIVDGSAFGPYINKIIKSNQFKNKKVILLLPESFEFLLLISKLFDNYEDYLDMIERTEFYADIREYLTWERFYTELIMEVSKNKGREKLYKKSKLPDWYLQEAQINKVINTLKRDYNIRIKYDKFDIDNLEMKNLFWDGNR